VAFQNYKTESSIHEGQENCISLRRNIQVPERCVGRSQIWQKRLSSSSYVCPSVRIEQLGSHWMDFHEHWYLKTYRKSTDNNDVSLKSDKKTGTLHEDQHTFMIISRSVLLRGRNVSDKSCTENQNTHFMFSKFFPKIVPFMG
jgi:hypothetical protein